MPSDRPRPAASSLINTSQAPSCPRPLTFHPPEVGCSWVTGGEPSLHLLAGQAWGLGAVSALSRGGPGPLHFPSGTWNHFMSVRTPTPDFHNC